MDEPREGPSTDEPDYLGQRAREALARDERVGELGLEVQVCRHDGHDEVSVSGKVTTEERRAAVAVVVEEIVPGAVLHNEVVVVSTGPPDVERLL